MSSHSITGKSKIRIFSLVFILCFIYVIIFYCSRYVNVNGYNGWTNYTFSQFNSIKDYAGMDGRMRYVQRQLLDNLYYFDVFGIQISAKRPFLYNLFNMGIYCCLLYILISVIIFIKSYPTGINQHKIKSDIK